MGKIHSNLEWLTAAEAVEHLGDLIGDKITLAQLMRQCATGGCNAYLEPPPEGQSNLREAAGMAFTSPRGSSHHAIHSTLPATWGQDQELRIWLRGDITQFDFPLGGGELLPPDQRFGCRDLSNTDWVVRLKGWQFEPRFKRAEIEALAEKINGESAQSRTVTASLSDATLGATIRQQRKDFANRPREGQEARDLEYQRWRDEGTAIQRERRRKASKRELAKQIKENLGLPDSIDTIRKRL